MIRYILILLTLLSYCHQSVSLNNKKVSVILPIQHQALDDIVSGFTQELHKLYKEPLDIKILNAQGDYNVQSSMLQQAKKDKDTDLVVTVATSVLQSAASIIENKPVIGLAALYSKANLKARRVQNVSVVQDEIPASQALSFIKSLFPKIKKITLVHSNNPKVQEKVVEIQKISLSLDIKVQKLLVPNLVDLYSVSKYIDKDSEIIFILKDSLIASGIKTLKQQSEQIGKPLVTSDEGTVINGADIALGVIEADIGAEGAKIASNILHNVPTNTKLYVMKDLTLFYNEKSNISESLAKSIACTHRYKFQKIKTH